MMKKPQLFVIATPIGNKKDLGQRAVEVLKNVDFIACEDCRTSKKLLDELGVETKLVSYHKFNEKQRTNELLKLFEEGTSLISNCDTLLNEAEQKVVKLRKGQDGEPEELPFGE